MKQIRAIMNPDVETIPPTATVQKAADRMRTLDLGALPVCEEGRIIGVVTDREMTVHIAAVGRDPSTTLVKDIMNSDPAIVSQDEDVKAAENAMESKGTHRVFAIDQDRRLVGIVSLGKIAKADNQKAAGKVVRTISRSRKIVG